MLTQGAELTKDLLGTDTGCGSLNLARALPVPTGQGFSDLNHFVVGIAFVSEKQRLSNFSGGLRFTNGMS